MKKPRSKKEIEKIRGRILAKALDIIVKNGFSSLTMRAIAGKTGMSAPNIYNYFSGKDEIYITLVIQGFEMLYKKLEQAADPANDPIIQAKAMIQAYLCFGMENPGHYDIMFTLTTPKYDDYVGTPFEKLSEVEYRISMDIALLAQKTVQSVMTDSMDEQFIQHRVVAVWALLHGMVSLHNSKVVSYVVTDMETAYAKIVDEILDQNVKHEY